MNDLARLRRMGGRHRLLDRARDAMRPIAVVANAMHDEDDVLDVEIGRRRAILEQRRIAGEIVQRRRGTGG
jgi:hypothetical protein